MSVEQFIDQIAGKGLLDEALLQRLRRSSVTLSTESLSALMVAESSQLFLCSYRINKD